MLDGVKTSKYRNVAASTRRRLEKCAFIQEAALALHIAGMLEDGDDIPEPIPMDRIEEDPESGPKVGRPLVKAELSGKAVRVNITLDEGLLSAIDGEAKRRETSR